MAAFMDSHALMESWKEENPEKAAAMMKKGKRGGKRGGKKESKDGHSKDGKSKDGDGKSSMDGHESHDDGMDHDHDSMIIVGLDDVDAFAVHF